MSEPRIDREVWKYEWIDEDYLQEYYEYPSYAQEGIYGMCEDNSSEAEDF